MQYSSPGKAVLIGEYGVLDGGLGVVGSCAQRAIVQLRLSESWHISSSLQSGLHTFGPEELHRDSLQNIPDKEKLWRAVISRFADEIRASEQCYEFYLDTSAFFAGENKLGLGSSAALCAALCAAVSRACSLELDADGLLIRAADAHALFSGKRGSGIDVRAAVFGGQLLYQKNGIVEPLRPLPGIFYALAFSGQSVSTRCLVEQFEKAKTRKSSYGKLFDNAQAIVSEFISAHRAQKPGDVLAALEAYGRWMDELGQWADIPVWTNSMRSIAKEARALGVACKPSGAGGGDVVLLASDEATQLDDLLSNLDAQGIQCWRDPLHAAATSLAHNVQH